MGDRPIVGERPEGRSLSPRRARRRLAVISLHTSPTASLGHSANGGLNVYVREVCAAFGERGIATDVFTRAAAPAAAEVEWLSPLSRVVNLPAGPPELDKHSLFPHVEAFAESVAAWAERNAVLYDLLYSHYWLSGAAACTLRGALRLPWAHTAHTLAVTKNRNLARGATPESELRVRLEGEIARCADLLVVSTATEREDLAAAYGIRRDRSAVIAPGVDGSLFRPHDRAAARRAIGYPGARLLVFVGRLERLKGGEVALRAFAAVAERHRDVRLLVLGEDSRDAGESEKQRLLALARELGIVERVDFLGSVPQARLPRYYSAAEACLMPSYSESFGLVGLEAQACGCPVVVSATAGLGSVVRDDVTGYIVSGDDPAVYADRTARLLDDPALSRQMGRRGHLLAQRFSWSRTADRLESCFEELIEAQLGVQLSARQE
jgi:D-inositol-3-phosphate glycosyltransferase